MEHIGERPDREGLGEPGHSLEEDMPPGQESDEEPLHHHVLADDPLAYLGQHVLHRKRHWRASLSMLTAL